VLIKASDWFDPMLEVFNQTLNDYDIQGADETRLQVLNEPGRNAAQKSWLWIRQGGPPDKPVVLLHYDASRAAHVPKALLSGYQKGKLVVDGYAAYESLAKEQDLTIVNCHDHSRRKFKEAWDSLSAKQKKTSGGIANLALQRYKKLYKIEAKLKQDQASPETIANVRQTESLVQLQEFKDWCQNIQSLGIANEKTRKAVAYFLNHYQGLIQYCFDHRLPISNIGTEHIAKQVAIVRKNFLFANTPSGATASAKIFSILLTALANGHEPNRYLTVLLNELPKLGHYQPNIQHLLPWNISPEQVAELHQSYPSI